MKIDNEANQQLCCARVPPYRENNPIVGEKEKNAANTEKLLEALSERRIVEEEKTKALEKKEKEWADRGEPLV